MACFCVVDTGSGAATLTKDRRPRNIKKERFTQHGMKNRSSKISFPRSRRGSETRSFRSSFFFSDRSDWMKTKELIFQHSSDRFFFVVRFFNNRRHHHRRLRCHLQPPNSVILEKVLLFIIFLGFDDFFFFCSALGRCVILVGCRIPKREWKEPIHRVQIERGPLKPNLGFPGKNENRNKSDLWRLRSERVGFEAKRGKRLVCPSK